MGSNEGKYNIKAVSSLLGIQPGTLRAWERRYKMIAPVRNEAGHRLYTEEHLKVLKWLITKVNQGFTISQAISLMENSSASIESPLVKEKDSLEELSDKLLHALIEFNSSEAHELINHGFSLYTVDKTVIDLLGPILIRIGDLWEEGKITSAHEHYASSFLRSRIEGIANSFPHSSFLPQAVAVCGPDERHELGLLIFTLFLRRKGFDVIYLGTSVAENDLELIIEKVRPKFLFLSCTLKQHVPSTLELAERLKADYENMFIGLGGIAIDSLSSDLKKKHNEQIVGLSRNEWEEWLKKHIETMN